MQIDRPITIALILFIILLLVFFLVVPEYNTFGKLQIDLGEKKAEYQAKYDYYSSIDKIFYELQNRKDEIVKIDNALPENSDLGEIIYFLQETAKSNGLIVKDLFLSKSSLSTSQNNTKINSVKDITFSMSVLGDYISLQDFILSLEKSSRIFEVTNISFSSASGSSLQSFSLQIKTYSY